MNCTKNSPKNRTDKNSLDTVLEINGIYNYTNTKHGSNLETGAIKENKRYLGYLSYFTGWMRYL
jgi:hypothetical protein